MELSFSERNSRITLSANKELTAESVYGGSVKW